MDARTKRLLSALLFSAGIVLVFSGLSGALGFTLTGMVASVGAIAALLYAGATWFGTPVPAASASSVQVFDHTLRLPSGVSVLAQFPPSTHAELRMRCTAALNGQRGHLVIGTRAFHVTPIVSADGAVLYGALVEVAPLAQAV